MGFLLIAVLFLLFKSCKKAPPQLPPQPVSYAVATTEDVPLFIETFGNCVSVANITIIPQVTNVLTQTLFNEGDVVYPGQQLFQIDPRIYEAALIQAQGNLKTAEGALFIARENLARQVQLFQTKVIDLQTLQTAQSNAEQAEGNLISAQGNLLQAQINLSYCKIVSPVVGKTGPYLINTGNLVTANQSKLVNIQTISPIYVQYTISENQMVVIRKYLAADDLDVEITIPGNSSYKTIGTQTFMDNNVSTQTGTLVLRATLPNEDQSLWPGLFVNVRLILTIIKNAILIPSQALLIGQQGPYVFIIKPDNTVAIQLVKPGQRHGDHTVIEQGLAAGDRVVLSGQLTLIDGKKVTPISPTPSPSPNPKPSPKNKKTTPTPKPTPKLSPSPSPTSKPVATPSPAAMPSPSNKAGTMPQSETTHAAAQQSSSKSFGKKTVVSNYPNLTNTQNAVLSQNQYLVRDLSAGACNFLRDVTRERNRWNSKGQPSLSFKTALSNISPPTSK